MKKILQILLIAFGIVTSSLAQTKVVETFNYSSDSINGQGSAGNGWGGPWTINGPNGNLRLVTGLNYTGLKTEGKCLEIAAQDGTGTEAIRKLDKVWGDVAGAEYWISFLIEIENPTSIDNSWQGFSLDSNGEQGYIGKLWGTSFLGINDPSPYLNVPSSYAWTDGLAWLVVKIKMSGDAGVDTTYMWINHDPSKEPTTGEAYVVANITLNNGFNAIRCHLGQTAGIIMRIDEIRMGTKWADVTSPEASSSFVRNTSVGQNSVKVYPNPFTDFTTISYELSSPKNVRLEIYSIDGRKLGSIFKGFQLSGRHSIYWKPVNNQGGIYLYKLQIGNEIEFGKLVKY